MMDNSELSAKYEIIRLLGEGANGKTWLASKRDTGDKVAIKQLRFSKLDNLKSYELFERETEVLKSVDVLGVPKYYECLMTNDGDVCLIQQYIEFPSLLSYIDEMGVLDEKCVLSLMMMLTDILIALHTQYSPPIVHRDIKPSNILCHLNAHTGLFDKVYLIDFGAVANPQKKSSGSTVAGTFGYMSPEQLLGDVTTQSDFYALGATAIHCLCGIAPYKLPTDTFTIRLAPVFEEKAPTTSPEMRKLIEILVAPDVADRPKNARILREYLRNVKDGRMPQDNTGGSICDDYLRSLSETHGDVNSLIVKSVDMARWLVTHALVRAIREVNGHSCFEYTFETLNATWAGVCPVSDETMKKKHYHERTLPFEISVSYDPANPRYNRINI